jgi:hypothetical protein
MADHIVITEKTSQAKDVRAAVGSRYGDILPAEGHLFDLLEPEDVVPAWKRWSPILLRPDGLYGTRPAEGGNKAAKLKEEVQAFADVSVASLSGVLSAAAVWAPRKAKTGLAPSSPPSPALSSWRGAVRISRSMTLGSRAIAWRGFYRRKHRMPDMLGWRAVFSTT